MTRRHRPGSSCDSSDTLWRIHQIGGADLALRYAHLRDEAAPTAEPAPPALATPAAPATPDDNDDPSASTGLKTALKAARCEAA